MSKKLGMPYMGSKRQLAKKIVDHIIWYNPNVKYVYDLFGGGGAISFELLQRNKIKKVIYNELNTGVVELLKKIRDDGITEEFYQWIDRDTFHKYKNEDTWYGGFVKVCYSFGNDQQNYLFNRELEQYKKNYHLVVVYGEDKLQEMKEYIEKYVYETYGISKVCNLKMPIKKKIQERRLEIRKQLTIYEKECKLEQLQQLERLERLQQLEQLQRLQQLEQLQQLQQLEQLQRLERLEIQNKSFEDVIIETPVEETVIYLDPPYKNTGKYQKVVCYDLLNKYIQESPYKIYLSSYEWGALYEVNCFDHRTTFSNGTNPKKVKEKLFCNREETKMKKKTIF